MPHTLIYVKVSSAGGHIILLQNNNKNCILSWSLTRIKRTVKSSPAAGCLALTEAIEETLYLKALICEILK